MEGEVERELQYLQAHNPKLYGALTAHINEVAAAIEAYPRHYPLGTQVRDAVDSPSADTRSYGQALTGLVKMGIIDVYTERVNSNRYDLTNCDYPRLRALQECIAANRGSE
ncbi:hypothetical protein ACFQE1_04505 [Halobium palmae]|uniref:Uncharacterized protein n=1 Tax=Halobium palmae TaxID=1776492 RepID=A0ABD5RW51_9EURY